MMETIAPDVDSPLIHVLPYAVMRDICEILDISDTWEEIAGSMPQISTVDVDGCRRYRSMGSPSWFLLRIWASKGYSILDLYNLFAITKMVRCMRLLRDHVDPKFHGLESYVTHSKGVDGVKLPLTSIKDPHTSVSNPFSRITEPSTDGTAASGRPSTNISNGPSTSLSTDPLMLALQNTLAAPYDELVAATNNFSQENFLGRGGYGVVYKGEWKQLMVAVKRISARGDKGNQHEKEQLRQSLQELRTLAKYRHDHILPLYAFSLEGPEPCLVYEYMANGSLEDRLLCRRGTPPLTWIKKREIAEGSARGLLYLHSTAKTPIIHGDVKSANILLNKHLEPKLGDFGLSRDGQMEADADDKSPLIASHIKGTMAYLPPEFVTSKILSTKLDVYSFGIVLLEIATGLRVFVDSRSPQNLLSFVLHAQSQTARSGGNMMRGMSDAIMDKRTPATQRPDADVACFCDMVRIGLQSAHDDRLLRPSFDEIVDRLRACSRDS